MAITNTSAVLDVYNAYKKTTDTGKTEKAQKSKYGNTVGNPKLSDEAAAYYEELKKKFSDMDFVLVSNDETEYAEAKAAKYANPSKILVLIDEEKIEKMATDESYRNKYESLISNATSQMDELKTQLESTGANVSGYGIRVNDDGTTSFFAVLKKSSEAWKERIEEKTAEKRAERKEANKEATKERLKERVEKAKDDKVKSEKADKKASDKTASEKTVTFSANSVEELIKKISDYTLSERSDNVMTEEELKVGQNFDFRG